MAAVIGTLQAEGDVTLSAALTGSVATKGVLAINAANEALVDVDAGSVIAGAYAVKATGEFAVEGMSSFGGTVVFEDEAAFLGDASFGGATTFGGDVAIGSTASLGLTSGNLAVPAGSAIDAAKTALVLGSGTLTVGATSITSGGEAVIKAATAAHVEVLLPKAGAIFLVSLEDNGTLAANATVSAGTTLDIAAGKTLTVGDDKTLTVSADGTVNAADTLALGGTATAAGGKLTLVKKGAGSTDGGKLQLTATGRLTTGAAAGTATSIASIVDITIGGKAVNNTSFGVADWKLDGAATDEPLQQLGGTAGSIAAKAADDVVIDSTKPVVAFAGPVINAANAAPAAGATIIDINGTGFKTTAALTDFNIGGGAASKVTAVATGATTIAISFTTTALAAGDEITIQAKTSAFSPVASAASNTVTFTVPTAVTAPLVDSDFNNATVGGIVTLVATTPENDLATLINSITGAGGAFTVSSATSATMWSAVTDLLDFTATIVPGTGKSAASAITSSSLTTLAGKIKAKITDGAYNENAVDSITVAVDASGNLKVDIQLKAKP